MYFCQVRRVVFHFFTLLADGNILENNLPLDSLKTLNRMIDATRSLAVQIFWSRKLNSIYLWDGSQIQSKYTQIKVSLKTKFNLKKAYKPYRSSL